MDVEEAKECFYGRACWFRTRCFNPHTDEDKKFWEDNPKKQRGERKSVLRGKRERRKSERSNETRVN